MRRLLPHLDNAAAVLGWCVAAWFGVIAASQPDRACEQAATDRPPHAPRAAPSPPPARPDPIATLLAEVQP